MEKLNTYIYNKSAIVTTTLKFTHSYLDSHGHKDCYCCYGKLKTEALVGHCKYYSTDPTSNIVYIEYIHVNIDQRRKGYATQFVKELQKNHILGWDYSFTSEGRKWYNALINQNVVDSHIISEQLQYV